MHAVHLSVLLKNVKSSHAHTPVAGPHADSVVVGITLTCAVLLFVMTLTAAGYYFVYKSATKTYSWCDLKCARKDVRTY